MSVGTVAVNLVARTSVFDRKMNSSRKRVAHFASGASKLKGVLVGLGAAAGAASLGALVKSSMQNIDAVGKLSDRIGETTENLAALGHAAEIAGTSKENLTKSLEMMIRRLGEAQQGLGQARYALDSMGLSLDGLVESTPAESFEKISKAIMQLPTATERAAAANNMFGRSGKDLLNLMEQVANEGIAGVREEAERLGITFSRLDAAKIEAANDSVTRLKNAFGGVVNRLAIELSPFLEIVADKFTSLGTGGVEAGEKIAQSFKGAGYAIVGLLKVFDWVKSGFEVMIGVVFKGISALLGALGKISDTAKVYSVAFKMESNDLFSKAYDDATKSRLAEMKTFFARLENKSKDMAVKIAEKSQQGAVENRLDLAVENSANSLNDLKNMADRLKDSIKTPAEKFKEFGEQLDTLVNTLDETGNSLLTRAQADELLAQKMKDLWQSPKEEKQIDAGFDIFRQAYVSVDAFKGNQLSPLLQSQREQTQIAKQQLEEQKKSNIYLQNYEPLTG